MHLQSTLNASCCWCTCNSGVHPYFSQGSTWYHAGMYCWSEAGWQSIYYHLQHVLLSKLISSMHCRSCMPPHIVCWGPTSFKVGLPAFQERNYPASANNSSTEVHKTFSGFSACPQGSAPTLADSARHDFRQQQIQSLAVHNSTAGFAVCSWSCTHQSHPVIISHCKLSDPDGKRLG